MIPMSLRLRYECEVRANESHVLTGNMVQATLSATLRLKTHWSIEIQHSLIEDE